MFSINSLKLINKDNEEFTYSLEKGINFFRGKNNSGKTVFYNFIDYMFGASNKIDKHKWFKDTLSYAVLEFEYNSITYELKRALKQNECYLKYKDEDWGYPIDLDEYKEKLNTVFMTSEQDLKDLREFAEENLSYRTFTLFNFFSENSSGRLNNFFEKGQEVRYFVKLTAILNFIFNKNLIKISKLREELNKLQIEVKQIEELQNRYEFIINNININLRKLKINKLYDGKNKTEVLDELNKMKHMNDVNKKSAKEKTVSELQAIYYNLDEQITVYENRISDSKRIENENINREKLIKTFADLIKDKPEFTYLINPVQEVLDDLDKSIAFSNYIIKNNTVKELKSQRDEVKNEIKNNNIKFTIFNIEEKARAIALVEEYINYDFNYDPNELERKVARIKELKNQIRELQNKDDDEKIEKLSEFITKLYKSASEVSEFVNNDIKLNGFSIKYIKKGNALQPVVYAEDVNNDENSEYVNYFVGSMARQTLIQLCGYLGFLKLLVDENIYPLIPILAIDHISKPFDIKNRKSIGEVLKTFYKEVGKDKIQIIMFDDKNTTDLNLDVNHSEDLVGEGKTGFNPFYHEVN